MLKYHNNIVYFFKFVSIRSLIHYLGPLSKFIPVLFVLENFIVIFTEIKMYEKMSSISCFW
jgi:hypothetical protein